MAPLNGNRHARLLSWIFLALAALALLWLWWLGGQFFIPSWKENGQSITKCSFWLPAIFILLSITLQITGLLKKTGTKRNARFWLRLTLSPLIQLTGFFGAAVLIMLLRFDWVEHVYMETIRYDDATELYLHHRSGMLPGDHEKDYVIWTRDGSLPFMRYETEADTGSGAVTIDAKTYRFRILEKNGLAYFIAEK